MKKLLALLLVLMLPALALAEATPTDIPAATVTVTGSATVRLKADQAQLTLGVVHQGDTVDAVIGENGKIVTAVMNALKNAGVDAADVVKENYTVEALYDYNHGKLGDQETVSGYKVVSTLRVTVRDLTQLAVLLNAATRAGANGEYVITFASTQSQSAADEALACAIGEGARKAALAAAAAGRTLGALVSITEGEGTYAGVYYDGDTSQPLLPVGLSFTTEVTMTYELN